MGLTLRVVYPAEDAFEHDAAIEEAVGTACSGSACDRPQPRCPAMRVIDFEFVCEAEALVAKQKVTKLGFETLFITPPAPNHAA